MRRRGATVLEPRRMRLPQHQWTSSVSQLIQKIPVRLQQKSDHLTTSRTTVTDDDQGYDSDSCISSKHSRRISLANSHEATTRRRRSSFNDLADNQSVFAIKEDDDSDTYDGASVLNELTVLEDQPVIERIERRESKKFRRVSIGPAKECLNRSSSLRRSSGVSCVSEFLSTYTEDEEPKTIEDLEWELERLKESTKSALELSWSEVERVQKENAELTAKNSALEKELEKLKKKLSSKEKGGKKVVPTPTIKEKKDKKDDFYGWDGILWDDYEDASTKSVQETIQNSIAAEQSLLCKGKHPLDKSEKKKTRFGIPFAANLRGESNYPIQEEELDDNSEDKLNFIKSPKFQEYLKTRSTELQKSKRNLMQSLKETSRTDLFNSAYFQMHKVPNICLNCQKQLGDVDECIICQLKGVVSDLNGMMQDKGNNVDQLERNLSTQNEQIATITKELDEIRTQQSNETNMEISILRDQIKMLTLALEEKSSSFSNYDDKLKAKEREITKLTTIVKKQKSRMVHLMDDYEKIKKSTRM